MRIYKAKDYADMSRKAANIVSAQVIMKPNCVLGLATGSTPIGLYKQLVEWFRKGDLDFSEVMTVNLDEYKGLSRENDQSYYYFMHQNLFDHVNIPVENTHLPNGMEPDSEKECRRYTELIQSLGGVDLQLLGIGHNGHIGFNEPGESFDKQVHCVNLTESTIEANKRFFASAEDVPKQAALYSLPETVVFVLQLPAALAFIRYTVFFQRHHTIRFFKIRHIKLGLFLLFDRKQKLCCLLIPIQ